MGRPAREPLGLYLTRVSRTVSRAFDAALAEAGGSLPVWVVLISLKSGQLASQRELAGVVGIQGATLSHHLDAMESAGLVTRRRDRRNRRLHLVELTPDGDALFARLREVASAFDRRLRGGSPSRTSTGSKRSWPGCATTSARRAAGRPVRASSLPWRTPGRASRSGAGRTGTRR